MPHSIMLRTSWASPATGSTLSPWLVPERSPEINLDPMTWGIAKNEVCRFPDRIDSNAETAIGVNPSNQFNLCLVFSLPFFLFPLPATKLCSGCVGVLLASQWSLWQPVHLKLPRSTDWSGARYPLRIGACGCSLQFSAPHPVVKESPTRPSPQSTPLLLIPLR